MHPISLAFQGAYDTLRPMADQVCLYATRAANSGEEGPRCDTAAEVALQLNGGVSTLDSVLPTGDEYFKPTQHVFDDADRDRLARLVNTMIGAGFLGLATVGGGAATSWYRANKELKEALGDLRRALVKFEGTAVEKQLTFLMQPGLATKTSPVYNLEGWGKDTVAELNLLPLVAAQRDQLVNLVNTVDRTGRAYWELRLNANMDIDYVVANLAQRKAEGQKLIPLDREALARQARNREPQGRNRGPQRDGASTNFLPSERLRPQGPTIPWAVTQAKKTVASTEEKLLTLRAELQVLEQQQQRAMANGQNLSPLPPDRSVGYRNGRLVPELRNYRQQSNQLQQQIRTLRAKVQSQKTQLEGKQGRGRAALETSIQHDEQIIRDLETASLPYRIPLKEREIQYQEELLAKVKKHHDEVMHRKPTKK